MNRTSSHTFFIFEPDYRRFQESFNDLGGTEIYAHRGTAEGVLREISNELATA